LGLPGAGKAPTKGSEPKNGKANPLYRPLRPHHQALTQCCSSFCDLW